MWNWLTDEATLRALGAIGGVISFLWGVGWAIYQYVQQSKFRAAEEAKEGSEHQKSGTQVRRPTPLLTMLGSVLALWAAVLFMAGASWWIWNTFIVETKPIISLVCRAWNAERCPPGATLVSCDDPKPAIDEVRRSCKSLTVKKVMGSDGGKCGHTAWELTCTPKG